MTETKKEQSLSLHKNKLIMKPTGLAAKVAAAKNSEISKTFDPMSFPNRIGLIIDDSGSMGNIGMQKVHEGIDAFCKNCNYGSDALAIYPLNAEAKPLTNDLALVAIFGQTLEATGGTPLYEKLVEMLSKEPITRAVAFSDGEPNGGFTTETVCITQYKDKNIPIDAIFIGHASSGGYKMMERLAELTGGQFLHFTDVSVLGKSLKYLAPRLRYMLENAELKEKIQKGQL